MTIMQGDSYSIPFSIEYNGASVVSGTGLSGGISKIEITIGNVTKTYPVGSETSTIYLQNDMAYFPILQSDSFLMDEPQRVQVRILLNNNGTYEVVGAEHPPILIKDSLSKAVLSV